MFFFSFVTRGGETADAAMAKNSAIGAIGDGGSYASSAGATVDSGIRYPAAGVTSNTDIRGSRAC
jgi:ATP-dependent protease HslVU (ClpYQ) peptidase subunit